MHNGYIDFLIYFTFENVWILGVYTLCDSPPSSLRTWCLWVWGIYWIQTDKGAFISYNYIYIYTEYRLTEVHSFHIFHTHGLNTEISRVYVYIYVMIVWNQRRYYKDFEHHEKRAFINGLPLFFVSWHAIKPCTHTRTGATGDRLKETQAINKSLSALGDVFTGKFFQIVSSLLNWL